jgi:tetratricopeptide (TPR) repeat protein
VQDAVRDGEKLPSLDPEPYYSRAEIWSTLLDNQEEALLDTLRGVEALLEGKDEDDPAELDKALRKLRDAAWLSLQRPKSVFPGSAQKHYGAGLRAYGAGNFDEAAEQFTRAIQLDRKCPEYYYFRSLAYLSVGDKAQAINDAEKGVLIESRLSHSARMEVSRSLIRVQGPNRLWLEGYRRGRPTYNPQRDDTLPARLAPDSRSPRERARIKGSPPANDAARRN